MYLSDLERDRGRRMWLEFVACVYMLVCRRQVRAAPIPPRTKLTTRPLFTKIEDTIPNIFQVLSLIERDDCALFFPPPLH
ncbi:hypothetical protein CPB86DRAFT_287954 [Serendipita vermifera]|nr:hypothetical protein CPB86DRAFT_287954 [Serendipita vermifera]